MFNEEFIDNLPEDLNEALIQICDVFVEFHNENIERHSDFSKEYKNYLEAYGFLMAFIESNGLKIVFKPLKFQLPDDINEITETFRLIRTSTQRTIRESSVINAKEKYITLLGKGFSYVFTDGDISRIQTLINELRDLIAKSKSFEENHKERLLKKLEKLQAELHKKMSSLDKFWGLIGDAGVILGKFGEDAKPFVDRFQEIAQIVWGVQARTEELQSGLRMPLLMPQKKEETDKGEK
jgi:hypothetical protein